jgi:hypothetical protein
MSSMIADPAIDRRFDRRLPAVIEWRGETYANTRTNITFMRLWGKILNKHAPVPVADCFGEIMYHRPAGEAEHRNARYAVRMLRDLWYPR